MPGTLELALNLAPKMVRAYKKLAQDGKLDGNLVPDENDVVGGLLRLVKDEFLTQNDLSKAANKAGDGWIEIIDLAASAVQKYAGLKKDGIMAGKTIQWLLFAKRCHGKLNADRQGIGAADQNARFGATEIRYYVEPELLSKITGLNVATHLEAAFAAWKRVALVMSSQTPKRTDANVIVKLASIDGRSNVLADAHVGPPAGREQLELRFDNAEEWASSKFLATASHEIGHLLGLSHTGVQGHLMNPTLGDIIAPTVADGKELVKIGYKPTPTFKKLVERQTPDDVIIDWNIQ